MTYICCICHGTLTDKAPRCNGTEARRMLACCMLRNGALPTLMRNDRVPKLKNALMAESMGIMAPDVMQCFPNETGEPQHVLEFVVYSTPAPHGFTPKDIDRRWSLATPLDRELQRFKYKNSNLSPSIRLSSSARIEKSA